MATDRHKPDNQPPGDAETPGPQEPKIDIGDAPGLIPKAQLEALLKEYAYVFPTELPAGLPPDRNTGHTIVQKLPDEPDRTKNRTL
jgi:hypothetical protein